MTVYTANHEIFYNLTDVKKYMKENNCKGFKTKIYHNGDVVNCGEVTLKGSNKCHIVGSSNSNNY